MHVKALDKLSKMIIKVCEPSLHSLIDKISEMPFPERPVDYKNAENRAFLDWTKQRDGKDMSGKDIFMWCQGEVDR